MRVGGEGRRRIIRAPRYPGDRRAVRRRRDESRQRRFRPRPPPHVRRRYRADETTTFLASEKRRLGEKGRQTRAVTSDTKTTRRARTFRPAGSTVREPPRDIPPCRAFPPAEKVRGAHTHLTLLLVGSHC